MDTNREKWTPASTADKEQIYQTLDAIFASPQFRNSRRYPDLLRYVVEQAFDGNIDQIKERSIGIDVFGRPADYDTHTDTIVRYTAGEVRKRLALYNTLHPEAAVQVALSARSYQPEFYRQAAAPADTRVPEALEAEAVAVAPARFWRWSAVQTGWVMLWMFVGALLCLAGSRIYMDKHAAATNRFWAPILRSNQPVLIASGGFTLPANQPTSGLDGPYVSFENALALGRISALLTAQHHEYQIRATSEVSVDQMRNTPLVLIGAYNNLWTIRLMAPLRFHFMPHPNEAIVDSWHPEKRWIRNSSQPGDNTPDYGLIARFHDPTTDSTVLAIAGLKRYGTDAVTEFTTSPRFLALLDSQAGRNWNEKNIEVLIRVNVVNGRAGAPVVEALHVWP